MNDQTITHCIRFEREDARKKYNRDVNENVRTLHAYILFKGRVSSSGVYLVDKFQRWNVHVHFRSINAG